MSYKAVLNSYGWQYTRTLCLKCNGGKVIEVYKNNEKRGYEVHVHAAGNIFRVKKLGISKHTAHLESLEIQLQKI